MYRLLVLSSLFVLLNAGLVRIPKIYNALISSDENLSPSHAIPVIEPVFRTTALGVAFPPVFLHSPLEEQPKPAEKSDDVKPQETEKPEKPEKEDNKKENNLKIDDKKPVIAYHGSLYPFTIDPYFPYSYTPELLFPALPYYQHYQQPFFVDLDHFNKDNKKKEERPAPAANFDKNPEIPDVPPPPLPVNDKKQ